MSSGLNIIDDKEGCCILEKLMQHALYVNTMDWDGFKQVFNDKYYNFVIQVIKTSDGLKSLTII